MSRKSVIQRLVTWLFAAHKKWVRSRQTDRRLTLWRSTLRRSVDLEKSSEIVLSNKIGIHGQYIILQDPVSSGPVPKKVLFLSQSQFFAVLSVSGHSEQFILFRGKICINLIIFLNCNLFKVLIWCFRVFWQFFNFCENK